MCVKIIADNVFNFKIQLKNAPVCMINVKANLNPFDARVAHIALLPQIDRCAKLPRNVFVFVKISLWHVCFVLILENLLDCFFSRRFLHESSHGGGHLVKCDRGS